MSVSHYHFFSPLVGLRIYSRSNPAMKPFRSQKESKGCNFSVTRCVQVPEEILPSFHNSHPIQENTVVVELVTWLEISRIVRHICCPHCLDRTFRFGPQDRIQDLTFVTQRSSLQCSNNITVNSIEIIISRIALDSN